MLFGVYLGYDAIAKFLLANGANITERDKFGHTPLHIAASYGKLCFI